MMKRFKHIIPVILSVTFLVSNVGYARQGEGDIVSISGKVVDAENQEPLKAVVEYKSLPNGNEVGKISSNDQGEFTIYVHAGNMYSFTVGSEGYFAYYEEISASADISKDIVLDAGDVGYVFTLEELTFAQGSAEITETSHTEIDIVIGRLNQFPGMIIQLEGHTDFRGNADLNMQLSRDRVNAVKKYITDRGISETRVATKAFGGTMPRTQEDTPEGHAHNRRVEVRILKVE